NRRRGDDCTRNKRINSVCACRPVYVYRGVADRHHNSGALRHTNNSAFTVAALQVVTGVGYRAWQTFTWADLGRRPQKRSMCWRR
ncbi:hypothetical protein J6590_081031, partial [Homalodisca vitripennis]